MTVQELINELNKLEDKDMQVVGIDDCECRFVFYPIEEITIALIDDVEVGNKIEYNTKRVLLD